jgi:hypothetical protein
MQLCDRCFAPLLNAEGGVYRLILGHCRLYIGVFRGCEACSKHGRHSGYGLQALKLRTNSGMRKYIFE